MEIEATYRGESIIDGACSPDRLGDEAGRPLAGRMISLLHLPRQDDGVCPHCGWTDAEHESTSRVGCPLCYSALSTVAGAVFPSLSPPEEKGAAAKE